MRQERRVTGVYEAGLPSVLRLFANAESFDQTGVSLGILAFEVVEEASSPTDEHEKPAARVVILGVDLEVLGQVADTLAQDRDLHFW